MSPMFHCCQGWAEVDAAVRAAAGGLPLEDGIWQCVFFSPGLSGLIFAVSAAVGHSCSKQEERCYEWLGMLQEDKPTKASLLAAEAERVEMLNHTQPRTWWLKETTKNYLPALTIHSLSSQWPQKPNGGGVWLLGGSASSAVAHRFALEDAGEGRLRTTGRRASGEVPCSFCWRRKEICSKFCQVCPLGCWISDDFWLFWTLASGSKRDVPSHSGSHPRGADAWC